MSELEQWDVRSICLIQVKVSILSNYGAGIQGLDT